jgi:FUN14 family
MIYQLTPFICDTLLTKDGCITIHFSFAFFLLERYSLHASITTAVDVVSLSSAYCFNCLMRVFGNNHVVLTFICSILVIVYTRSLLGNYYKYSHIYSNLYINRIPVYTAPLHHMNVENLSSITITIGGGFLAGALIGFALKKVLKILAIVVGLFFSGLVYLQYQ